MMRNLCTFDKRYSSYPLNIVSIYEATEIFAQMARHIYGATAGDVVFHRLLYDLL